MFTRFQRAVKFFPPQMTIAAMEKTAGTGMYPRDLLMAASLGTNVLLAYEAGWPQPMMGDGLYTFTAAGGETSIDFTAIPAGYSALLVQYGGRTTKAATTDSLAITLNNDTASNYDSEAWNRFGQADAYGVAPPSVGVFSGNTAPANYASVGHIIIPRYSGTTFYKLIQGRGDVEEFHSAGGLYTTHYTVAWRSAAAINRVTLKTTSAMVAGSRATIYGLF